MAAQDLRNPRQKRMFLIRIPFITANEPIGLGINARQKRFLGCGLSWFSVISPRDPVLGQVRFPWCAIQPNVVGFEERAEFVILLLSDRIIFVTMAPRAF